MMTEATRKPLWSDLDIYSMVFQAQFVCQGTDISVGEACAEAMREVVNDYEAALAQRDARIGELEAELAQGWEDVPLNTRVVTEGGARWDVCDDGEIAVAYPGIGLRMPLPANWRLQRERGGNHAD